MENSSALATPTMLPLTRTCFIDEQDRANEIARHMRIPVESGESVTGESATEAQIATAVADYLIANPPAVTTQPGPPGPKPTPVTEFIDIANGVDEVEVNSTDNSCLFKIRYNNTIAPVTNIGVLCYWVDEVNEVIKVYLNTATTDAFYQLAITKWV